MGLNSSGFTTQSLSEIIDDMNASLLAIFPTLNITELTEPEQQLVGVFAEVAASLNELSQNIYSGFNIDTAQGDSLDIIGNLLGVRRLQAAPSTVTATITGTAATVIPVGTLFSVDGEPDIIVETDVEVTIPGGGSIAAECTATETGVKIINSGTLTIIDTPVAGMTAVTNASAGVLGRAIETDAAYRIRLASRKSSTDSGTAQGIKESILATNIDGATTIVEHVTVAENDTGLTVSSRPAHSFETYVYQSSGATSLDSTIAQAILDSKGAGIQTYGVVSETAVDSNGDTAVVKFSRVDEVVIHTDVTVTTTSSYPIDGDDQIKDAVLEYGNALGVGVDVNYAGLQANIVTDVPGIDTIVLKVDIVDPPTGTSNIVIDDGSGGAVEVSTWAIGNIDVTSS